MVAFYGVECWFALVEGGAVVESNVGFVESVAVGALGIVAEILFCIAKKIVAESPTLSARKL
jgi:hypothetical protein